MILVLLLAMAAQAQDAECDLVRGAALQEEARNATSQRQYSLAARRLEEAAAACPGNRAVLLTLAETRAAAREYDAAVRAAERYLESDPESVSARNLLAGAYLMARRPREALAEA